jgi:DNA mismatch endonuclease (patch repair protein)
MRRAEKARVSGPPPASSPAALKRMRSARQRDTQAEIELRRLLHARGLRFRVHRAILPGVRRHADIAFVRARVAVFVDGCFWHCCPIHRSFPRANARWWAEKLRANRRRDADTNRRLRLAGWHVERVWEHESPDTAAARVAATVRRRIRPAG